MLQFYFFKLLFISNFKEISPQGAWRPLRVQAVHCKLVFFWGLHFSEYGMNRKNSINQPNATSVTFHSVMHGLSHGDQHDVVNGVGN